MIESMTSNVAHQLPPKYKAITLVKLSECVNQVIIKVSV